MGTLVSSGQLRFSDLRDMYVGGAGAISLSALYKGGTNVPDQPSSLNIPASGALKISDYFGTAKEYVITLASNQDRYNWRTAFTATYPSTLRSDYTARLIIPSNVTVGSTSTSSYALTVGTHNASTKLYLDVFGNVHGAGAANGGNGGSAIDASTGITTQTVQITVKSTGRVYGGGGGGGRGGDGGTGGKGGDGYGDETRFYAGNRVDIWTGNAFIRAWYWDGALVSNTSGNSQVINSNLSYLLGAFRATIAGYWMYDIIRRTTTSGGSGGAGGNGGNGGKGIGYDNATNTGNSGSNGSSGNAGGANAGTGGTGGRGGNGGAGGAFGLSGSSGSSGSTGSTGGNGLSSSGATIAGLLGSAGFSGSVGGLPGSSIVKHATLTTVVLESGSDVKPSL